MTVCGHTATVEAFITLKNLTMTLTMKKVGSIRGGSAEGYMRFVGGQE